jgi:3-oxoacyl-[acyl-carrier-protein] synthase III
VVTNNDLLKYMDTSDEWIQERTGIKERRYAHRTDETTTTMGVEAAKIAIERAGITPQDIDFIVFATLSPGYYFRHLVLNDYPVVGISFEQAVEFCSWLSERVNELIAKMSESEIPFKKITYRLLSKSE